MRQPQREGVRAGAQAADFRHADDFLRRRDALFGIPQRQGSRGAPGPGGEVMPDPIRYRIVAKDPAAHLFEVTLQVAKPAPQGQVLVLPAWIPGSYMFREFERHIVRIRDGCNCRTLALEEPYPHNWHGALCDGPA